MTKIYFGTTNAGKLVEARDILGIEVIGTPLEIDEIQSLDPLEVATKKALAYYCTLQKPVLIEDLSLSFTALKQLPGPYISSFEKALDNRGLIALLTGQSDRSAVAQTTLAFATNPKKVVSFVGTIEGKIAHKPAGTNGFGWDPIFIPKGFSKTFAQMTAEEKNAISMRRIALEKFRNWLENNP